MHFYNACINSQFLYCASVWGNCTQSSLLQLLRIQKRAARILLATDFSTPSVVRFGTLNWFPIVDMIKLRKLVVLFSVLVNPDSPFCIRSLFSFVSSSGRATRSASSNNLILPLPRTNYGKRTFTFSAVSLFNVLPVEIELLASCAPPEVTRFLVSVKKKKLQNFFLPLLNGLSHLEERFCHTCRFYIDCNCYS